jgi:hypothetical protein
MTPTALRKYGLLGCVLLATVAAYWVGLHGPFVLDDDANFAVIGRWLDHAIGWRQAMFGVDSGPTGRPLSMASFMLSGWLGGLSPWAFKAGNLLVHLVNGVLLFALALRLAARDPVYRTRACAIALVLASLWLLHPLLVSTVLYAVQRMAMLSATFMLLGLIAYCRGRDALERDRAGAGFGWLFLAVPACTLLAGAAKENGLLLPVVCAVLEACYFIPAAGQRRPALVRAFLWLGVALPLLAGLVFVAWHPGAVLAGYAGRSFTLGQRLLTEARILWDYVASILLPWGPRLSLYRDDYPVSTGWLAPPSTLLAIVAWIAVLALAWRLRRRVPALGAGLGIFLVGHVVESSVLPLLLYFEHRNYFPMIGVLWAAAALVLLAARALAPRMDRPRPVFATGLALLLLGFGLATYARARVWSDRDTLLAASLRASPGSRWLRMDLARVALQRMPADAAGARRQYAALEGFADPASRQIGAQGQVVVDCGVDGVVDPARVQALFANGGHPLEVDQYQMLDMLGNLLLRRPCQGLPAGDFARRLSAWMDRSPTPEANRLKQNLRFLAAQLLIADRQFAPALAQAQRSWQSGARELPLAAMIIDLQITLGQTRQARALLDAVTPSIAASDIRGRQVFSTLRGKLDAGQPR